ncbi:exonuclease [Pseudomonas phage Stalingrad]|uniref:Exonuclease n=1 Tax=Pseudomonas phage Stalingrad TaxID=2762287 RepID=A0A7G8LJ56_9CAUD|nr:exonuclease [Pseudomonas phage Stalingrad]
MRDKKMTIGLAHDMDYLIFSAMSASESEMDWGDDVWTLECDHKQARSIMYGTIKQIRKEIAKQLEKRWPKLKGAYEFKDICVISGKGNFRLDILESYKGNRVAKRKPVGYPDFCQKTMDHFEANGVDNAFRWDGVEGDDVIGILMTKPELAGCDRVIGVSCDKDFNTIPGDFFWLTHNQLVRNDLAAADKWHMRQTCMGDTTDGYGGIPQVGESFEGDLMAWLDEPKFYEQYQHEMLRGPRKGQFETRVRVTEKPEDATLWDCMVSLAKCNGMSEEDLLVQARCARILRASDWDFEKKEPILWTP